MKAITMRIQKFSRPGVILMATVVAIITSMVTANAVQSITTPNAAFVSWNLNGGATSAPITTVTQRSVLVMGSSVSGPNGFGEVGVGQVTLQNIGAFGIIWVGLESTSGAAITQGVTATAGTHIVYMDFQHKVDIQVAGPASGSSIPRIQIHNGSNGALSGNVTLIW